MGGEGGEGPQRHEGADWLLRTQWDSNRAVARQPKKGERELSGESVHGNSRYLWQKPKPEPEPEPEPEAPPRLLPSAANKHALLVGPKPRFGRFSHACLCQGNAFKGVCLVNALFLVGPKPRFRGGNMLVHGQCLFVPGGMNRTRHIYEGFKHRGDACTRFMDTVILSSRHQVVELGGFYLVSAKHLRKPGTDGQIPLRKTSP